MAHLAGVLQLVHVDCSISCSADAYDIVASRHLVLVSPAPDLFRERSSTCCLQHTDFSDWLRVYLFSKFREGIKFIPCVPLNYFRERNHVVIY